jgi:nicotinamidase-related amidase
VTVELGELVAAPTTAVITMECQRGVVGDLATFPALREAVLESNMLAAGGALLAAARLANALVVHATVAFRPDRVGSPTNAPLLAYASTIPGQLLDGSPSIEVIPEFDRNESDLESRRRHGVSPFLGTDLDALLRAQNITTVVAIGASLNVGLLGLAIEAVNLGYRVVVPTDACVAVPASYGDAILNGTFRQLALLTDSAAVIQAWARRGARDGD